MVPLNLTIRREHLLQNRWRSGETERLGPERGLVHDRRRGDQHRRPDDRAHDVTVPGYPAALRQVQLVPRPDRETAETRALRELHAGLVAPADHIDLVLHAHRIGSP